MHLSVETIPLQAIATKNINCNDNYNHSYNNYNDTNDGTYSSNIDEKTLEKIMNNDTVILNAPDKYSHSLQLAFQLGVTDNENQRATDIGMHQD